MEYLCAEQGQKYQHKNKKIIIYVKKIVQTLKDIDALTHKPFVTIKTIYMTSEQKKQVRDALVRYAGNFDTQQLAAESLKGISASTISQVKNNNWELLSERMWHHIARQVGFYCGEWQPADTSAYLLLRILFSDAQHYAMAYGIVIGTGLGKTFTAMHYMRENDNTIYISGCEDYNRKSFMTALLKSAGIEGSGTVPQMIQQFTGHVLSLEEPLLIIDDADKLKDRVLHLLLLIASELSGKAGIAIMGGEQLRVRIIEGSREKKPGFEAIFNSIGRRFITLGSIGPKDAELICHANGIFDDDVIESIKQECSGKEHERQGLHVVAQLVKQYSNINMAA
jgi:hypothetical protein